MSSCSPSWRLSQRQHELFVYDDLQNYSFDNLSNKRRRITKQGIENFELRVFADPEEFVGSAYDVYLSFYNRTRYYYKSERVDREVFAKCGRKLFDNPKILKIGAYHGKRLCAVEVSHWVDKVIIGD
jgi:hypothetical protein